MDIIPLGRVPYPVPREKTVVALGFFDGVHRGHAALLQKTAAHAAETGAIPAVFTFHDDGQLKGGCRLLSEEERLRAFHAHGIRRVYLADFSALSSLSPHAFTEDILLAACGAVAAVCGFNFRFGHRGAGDATLLSTLLATHGVPLTILPAETEGGEPISSTRVREAIEDGRMEEAARLLGHPYTLTARVAHGKELGRRLGFPTANLPFFPHAALPAFGVYAVRSWVEGLDLPLFGVANVGLRPTVEHADAANCEVHLFDASPNLYGKEMRVELLTHLRGETRFSSPDELRAQIARDSAEAKEYIKKWNGPS